MISAQASAYWNNFLNYARLIGAYATQDTAHEAIYLIDQSPASPENININNGVMKLVKAYLCSYPDPVHSNVSAIDLK